MLVAGCGSRPISAPAAEPADGSRWPVQRTHSWMNGYGELRRCTEIPLFTLAGVKDADVTTHYFTTEDKIGLSMLRFKRGEAGEAVLIIHGLTTSSDMFIQPEHYNLVSYLLDHGFSDVWCLDFRMSNRHLYNLFKHRYTLDHIALFDFPPAIAVMRNHR